MSLLIISQNASETQKIGKLLANDLRGGEIFGLIGDLGAGKTTFIQGVAQGFKIKEKIKSPTFVILKRYKISNHKKLKWLYHLDLYRLPKITSKNENVLGFSLDEIIRKNSVVFIEWAEKIAPLLPKNWIKIKFEYINQNERRIIIN